MVSFPVTICAIGIIRYFSGIGVFLRNSYAYYFRKKAELIPGNGISLPGIILITLKLFSVIYSLLENLTTAYHIHEIFHKLRNSNVDSFIIQFVNQRRG